MKSFIELGEENGLMIDLYAFLWDVRNEIKVSPGQFVFESNIDDCGKLYYTTDREQSVSIFKFSDEKVTVNYTYLVEDSIDDRIKYQTHSLKLDYSSWDKLIDDFREESLFIW